MNTISALKPEDLYRKCDPNQFDFNTTEDIEAVAEIIGQPRAIESVRFGIGIDHDGYNIFALGPSGTGKFSLIMQFLKKRSESESNPSDWCYVCNFDDLQKPNALCLPSGKGKKLKQDITQLVNKLQTVVPATFKSEEYQMRRQVIEQEFREREQKAIEELQQRAKEKGLGVIRTPTGVVFAPMKDGEVLKQKDFKKLSEEERKHIENEVEALQKESQDIFLQIPRWEDEYRERMSKLNKEVANFAVGHLIDELLKTYESLPEVLHYLKELKKDIIENIELFLKPEGAQKRPENHFAKNFVELSYYRRYQVNLLVDRSKTTGTPIIYEDHPTYQNLVGRVEHIAEMGALLTDFNLIKAGSLHKANGGYLILDAQKVLVQPYAWAGLKRVLKSRQIRIESLGQAYSIISTVTLEPEPIPLNVKVILLGDRFIYYLLRHFDPEFTELFKVAADFDEQMHRTPDNHLLYAKLIASLIKKKELRPFDRNAVARIIEHSSRLIGDSEKLTTHFQSVVDLVRESDYWAGEGNNRVVSAENVQQAIDAWIYRNDRLRERIQEEILRGTVLIDSEGSKTGQVNGLSVIQLGDYSFGRPCRISARVRMGKGEVVNIEREVELSGPIHSKGVLILSGFLGGRYAIDHPLSLSASLVFEQSYSGIEGDSASSAELYALLSAIAEVPVKQCFAVTGSVNQHGQVQAIGGVNEKIEGFFDVCRARGLNGEQGVLIPNSNIKHLMLKQDIIEAVSDGKFHIFPVETIDQGIEILTGIPAGKPDLSGNYPEGSVNDKVKKRLSDLAEKIKTFASPVKEKRET